MVQKPLYCTVSHIPLCERDGDVLRSLSLSRETATLRVIARIRCKLMWAKFWLTLKRHFEKWVVSQWLPSEKFTEKRELVYMVWLPLIPSHSLVQPKKPSSPNSCLLEPSYPPTISAAVCFWMPASRLLGGVSPHCKSSEKGSKNTRTHTKGLGIGTQVISRLFSNHCPWVVEKRDIAWQKVVQPVYLPI